MKLRVGQLRRIAKRAFANWKRGDAEAMRGDGMRFVGRGWRNCLSRSDCGCDRFRGRETSCEASFLDATSLTRDVEQQSLGQLAGAGELWWP